MLNRFKKNKKAQVLYDYPLLKLLLYSFCLLLAYTIARMGFTIHDWMDNSYHSNTELLLKDMSTALGLIGFTGGIYAGLQVWLAIKYTQEKSKLLRVSAIALGLAISLTFIITGTHSSINEILDQLLTVVSNQ